MMLLLRLFCCSSLVCNCYYVSLSVFVCVILEHEVVTIQKGYVG